MSFSPPAPEAVPPPPLGMVRVARRILQVEDLFSDTCRRDYYCIKCQRAFCSHCCGSHHGHTNWGRNMIVRVGLDAGGRPVFPTHTTDGRRIPRFIAEEIAAEDYTSRLARDAFCLHCGRAFCAGVCSHHDHRSEGLPDAVVRVEERGGRHCVRCEGTEWWTALMDGALGDPVHVGEDERGQYYELLPVVRFEHGNCLRCGAAVPRLPSTFCSDLCNQAQYRETEERRRRREARHAALAYGGMTQQLRQMSINDAC
jgi:predicted nucleic acid-binding Zn ribbon protein